MKMQNEPIDIPVPRIVSKPSLALVGLLRRYRCDDKSGIPAQWGAFVPRIERISHRISEVAYGVCLNSTETEFDYFCGVEVPPASESREDFETLALPAQLYAVFAHQGRVEQIVDTVHRIFTLWLPKSGRVVGGVVDLVERYSEDFEPVSNSGNVEIWIPIQDGQ